MTDTVTNERLQEFLSLLGGMKDDQPAMSPPSFIKAIIAELLSRRSATAEPVAWVTEEILAAMKRGDRAVPGWKRTDAFCIPLYAAPPASLKGGQRA